MSYDEQRISDQIDSGLLQNKRKHIKDYVKKWMDGHESDTFLKNEHGVFIYSAGHSSLNLVAFFENLLEDYIDENKECLSILNKLNMTWVAVDLDGEEYEYLTKPKRNNKNNAWESNIYRPLPKSSIKKLIGRDLTWTDEPVELKEDEIN